MTTPSWVSLCARIATTTRPKPCGSGGGPTCGAGSPSPCGRLIAKTLGVPGGRMGDLATVQYAKVVEYQRRGVVHFHALIRLDGPRTPDGFEAPPPHIPSRLLVLLVQAAVQTTRLSVSGVDDDDLARSLAFGQQLDVRPV